ncbi:MAG: RNA polymerase sigma factor [Planctomycetota bacterium]|jgi:RNA polymerase sigma-70 factor (ECF subfamily)
MNKNERILDELLVLRCQEGDIEAFETLVGRWQERLWRHAWRLTGNESTAWDVLQEAWIAISQGLGRLTDAAAFPAWSYRIISNKCRDSARRERRWREATERYSDQMQPKEREATTAQQERASLKEAIGQLCGPDRAILSLRYEERFGTAQIASILGIPQGTVKSRLFYARQHLRKYLEKNDE